MLLATFLLFRSLIGHYLGAVLDRSWHSGLVGGYLRVVKRGGGVFERFVASGVFTFI